MLEKIIQDFIERHGLAGREVLCGFSGGADSTSLLLALHGAGVPVKAVHFQHGIRGEEAEGDAEWCREFCRSRSIELAVVYLEVPHHSLPGESTEEAARRLRLEQWKRLSMKGKLPVFLAHHGDDVLEELFLRLARGSNVSAIVPMKPWRKLMGMDVYRPFLKLRKAELEAWLREQNVCDWRIDGTNVDNEYRRNAVRNRLLPLFREIFGNDTGLRLAIDNLGADAECLDQQAAMMAGKMLSIDEWKRMPVAMMHRVLRRLLEAAMLEPPAMTHTVMERLRRELACYRGRTVWVPLTASVGFVISPAGIRVAQAQPSCEGRSWNWRQEAECQLENGCFHIVPEGTPGAEVFDADLLPTTLEIRSWQTGDRMVPFGAAASKKLQDIFSDGKVPRERRHSLPLLLAGNDIIWLPGVRRAAYAPITVETKNRLCIAWSEREG